MNRLFNSSFLEWITAKNYKYFESTNRRVSCWKDVKFFSGHRNFDFWMRKHPDEAFEGHPFLRRHDQSSWESISKLFVRFLVWQFGGQIIIIFLLLIFSFLYYVWFFQEKHIFANLESFEGKRNFFKTSADDIRQNNWTNNIGWIFKFELFYVRRL